MVSLSVWGSFTIIQLVLEAFALSWIARKLGSTRGRFKHAALASGLMLVTTFAGLIVYLESLPPIPDRAHFYQESDPFVLQRQQQHTANVQIAVGIMQLFAIFVIFAVVFRLSFVRTLALFCLLLLTQCVVVVLAILLVRPYLAEAYVVPTGSMAPTIDPGDRILVNKIQSPRRFDLVNYRSSQEGNPAYVKRLIALPGERLRFAKGDVYINDHKVDVPSVLAGRCRATITVNPGAQDLYRDGQTITLGSDDYFYLGDDVDISLDSRWQGPSPRSAIIGVVDVIYWPVKKMRIVR